MIIGIDLFYLQWIDEENEVTDPFWLILLLPFISVTACLMDSESRHHPRQIVLRVLRWNLAFLLVAGIEYFLIFD